MSRIRSTLLSLYTALTPALASAKCGNVDYSWGADALASVHGCTMTMMLYIVYLYYTVVGIIIIVSTLQVYIKMSMDEERAKKNIMMLMRACLSLTGATIAFPAFSGYQIWDTGDTR